MLLLLGARRTRKIRLPLFLCIFLLPIPFSFGDEILLRAARMVELMDRYGREILQTRVHGGSGAATFVLALATLYVPAGPRTIRAQLT